MLAFCAGWTAGEELGDCAFLSVWFITSDLPYLHGVNFIPLCVMGSGSKHQVSLEMVIFFTAC